MKLLEKRKIELNGKELEVKIYFDYEFDHDTNIDDPDFKSDKEKAQNGDIAPYNVIVKASALGERGFGILGGCWVSDRDHLIDYIDDYDMIENAINELRENILNKYNLLKTALE